MSDQTNQINADKPQQPKDGSDYSTLFVDDILPDASTSKVSRQMFSKDIDRSSASLHAVEIFYKDKENYSAVTNSKENFSSEDNSENATTDAGFDSSSQSADAAQDNEDKAPEKLSETGKQDLSPSERQKQVKEFGNWLNQNFASIDKDNNGQITRQEVSQIMRDPRHGNGNDAVNLATLYTNFNNLASTFKADQDNKTPAGNLKAGANPIIQNAPNETSSLTKKGLDKFIALANDSNFFERNDRSLAMAELASNFRHLDKDDWVGNLNPNEAKEASNNPDFSPRQRQALNDLYEHMTKLRDKPYKFQSADGRKVSDEDPTLLQSRDSMARLNRDEIADLASPEARVLNGISKTLSDKHSRESDLGKEKTDQGNNGTCFFIAPAIGMQRTNPQAVDRMIQKNQDGSYKVTFPGDPKNPQIVSAPTKAELLTWANGEQANILEKAAGQYFSKFPTKIMQDENYSPDKTATVPSERIEGSIVDSHKLLYGSEGKFFDPESTTVAELQSFLENASKNNLPISAATQESWIPESGIMNQHAYSIRYDAAAKQVILENPLKPSPIGRSSAQLSYEPHKPDGSPLDKNSDGIFRLSLEQVRKNFYGLYTP